MSLVAACAAGGYVFCGTQYNSSADQRNIIGLPYITQHLGGIDEVIHRNEIIPNIELIPENDLASCI